jgi:hypothetical protein
VRCQQIATITQEPPRFLASQAGRDRIVSLQSFHNFVRHAAPRGGYPSDVPQRGGGPSGERSSEPEEPSPRNDHRGQSPPRDAANAASTTERGLSPTNRRQLRISLVRRMRTETSPSQENVTLSPSAEHLGKQRPLRPGKSAPRWDRHPSSRGYSEVYSLQQRTPAR